ncbi:MAG: phenylalanine--tRNA ligase subunit beta [Pseudomonadota bacterium]
MRLSESWLREFVNPPVDAAQLIHQLTMAGLEVDSLEPVAGVFTGVVVAEVMAVEPHPDADRLRVCQVRADADTMLQIVCGAANVRQGLKVPLAREGAQLPGGLAIKRSKLRGVPSEGMLCSAKELGLESQSEGLLELPDDAPVGASIRDYLQLDDHIIEVDLTPNRADCLSVQGIAREVASINGMSLTPLPVPEPVSGAVPARVVRVLSPEACPRYLGCVIQGVNAAAPTPLWMRERLRRSGLRSLGIVVDVTNYVLLELGQPMHAFDLARLTGDIQVRHAEAGETLALLNDQNITLRADSLVIADDAGPLALAGVMGGAASAVSETTQDILLECAFFTPSRMMGAARSYGLATDSSHRFERGVDPELQDRALARAIDLIISHAGGVSGVVTRVESGSHLPVRTAITLRQARVRKVLGLDLPDASITALLERLGMQVAVTPDGWTVLPPGFRFDIAIEADLIEEIGRIYGYDHLPVCLPSVSLGMQPVPERMLSADRFKDTLVALGYQEAITYSFVDPAEQQALLPDGVSLALQNPISSEMAVMRASLWVGLLDAARKNLNRQQDRVRFFETGLCFLKASETSALEQVSRLGGVVLGHGHQEQWGLPGRAADFFDVKADVESLLALTGQQAIEWKRDQHPALHPGQCARLWLGGMAAGWLGMLHPSMEKHFGFEQPVFLFELDLARIRERALPKFSPVSRYPSVRRDLALLMDSQVSVGEVVSAIRSQQAELVRDVRVFDVYQGKGVPEGQKSIALGLTLQLDAETLTDECVDQCIQEVLRLLEHDFQARLRD